jgi:hypothetical protein
MVGNSDDKKQEVTLEAQLEFAVRAIQEDENLRVFVRQFLTFCRVLPPSDVFDVNPVVNARNQGIQAAGLEFAAMLTQVEPTLVPTLMLEELTADV